MLDCRLGLANLDSCAPMAAKKLNILDIVIIDLVGVDIKTKGLNSKGVVTFLFALRNFLVLFGNSKGVAERLLVAPLRYLEAQWQRFFRS